MSSPEHVIIPAVTLLTTGEITQEHKNEFILLLYDGYPPNEAAREIGTTASRIRRCANPKAYHYDPEFAKAWQEAEESKQHNDALLQMLRGAALTAALNGNTALLVKWLINRDPEWAHHKHQNFRVEHEIVQRVIPQLSTEAIREAIEQIKAGEQPQPALRALPPPR